MAGLSGTEVSGSVVRFRERLLSGLRSQVRRFVPAAGETAALVVASTAIGARGIDIVRPSTAMEVLEVLAAAGGAFLLVCLLLFATTFPVSTRSGAGPRLRAVRTVIVTVALYFWFSSDAIFYNMAKAHLSGEMVELTFIAEVHGEAGSNSIALFLLDVFVFTLTVVAALGLAEWLGIKRFPGLRERSPRVWGATTAVACALFVGVLAVPWNSSVRAARARYLLSDLAFSNRSPGKGLPELPKAEWEQARADWVECLGVHAGKMAKDTFHAREKPDIYFFHVEGLRADALDARTMPRLAAMVGGELTALPRHFSTGTQSSSGTYGLISGLPSYLYPLARGANLAPLPLAILKRLGYRERLRSASALEYDGLRDFFLPYAKHVQHPMRAREWVAAERAMMAELSGEIAAETGDPQRPPRFEYVYVYSTHYDYYYPPEHGVFVPAAPLGFEVWSGHEAMRRLRPELHNRYRNSVHFADELIADFLGALKAQHRFDDAVIVITGDHGEEFWELGRFGHTHGLNRYQTQVAALVHLPGGRTLSAPLSSHADIFPTIFDHMAVAPEPTYLGGGSLLRAPEQGRSVVVSQGHFGAKPAHEHMVVTPRAKIEINDRDAVRAVAVYDARDRELTAKQRESVDVRDAMARVITGARMGAARCRDARP
jgi:membrane-anchored protein YejM (alkaline phosphatase superfamily)